MNAPDTPIQRWENRVIHLNIAPPAAGPPVAPSQPTPEPSSSQRQLFSETYLKQEFPDHYTPQQQPDAGQNQHPAVQLQGFINGLGQEGWEFVGVFPIGQLVMMFFRRPLPMGPTPTSTGTTTESTSASEPPQPLLQQILQRLEALEAASLAAQSPTPALAQAPTPASDSRVVRQPGRILDRHELDQLPSISPCSTQQAAAALGLRSAGGLLSYGARHGFQRGLVKLVNTGSAAVYLGSEASKRGGLPVRLWMVLPQSALPPLKPR